MKKRSIHDRAAVQGPALRLLALLWLLMPPFALPGAFGQRQPEGHRAILVDWRHSPMIARRPKVDLMLVDLDAGKMLAKQEIPSEPDVAVSRDGQFVAVVAEESVRKADEPQVRLTVFRTNDLGIAADGYLPFKDTFGYLTPNWPVLSFSDDNSIVVVPHGRLSVIKQEAFPGFHNEWSATWDPIDWKAEQRDQTFAISSRYKAPQTNSSRAPILSSYRWPQIDIFRYGYGAIYTLDFSTGQVAQRLVIADDPTITVARVLSLEKGKKEVRYTPETREELLYNGGVHSSVEEVFAYRIPDARKPGRIKRIDLTKRPPVVVAESKEVYKDLDPFIAAASEKAGLLFVANNSQSPRGQSLGPPAEEIRVFDAQTLERRKPLDPGIIFASLAVSHDGRHLYVVSYRPPSIVVIDIATGEVINRFEDLVRWPTHLMPLPGAAPKQ